MKNRELWKKAVSVALATAMMVGVSACGSGGTEGSNSMGGDIASSDVQESSEAKGQEEQQESRGDEDEVVTLTLLGIMGGTDGTSTDDAVGLYLKEKLGIVIEYSQVSDDRLKVKAAGGDLPDIVQLTQAPGLLQNLIDAGALWAMDEWLEDNGDNLKEKLPDALKYSKEIVGKGTTYFIPTEVQIANPENPNKNGFVGFFTRWDYYKELGYPEISTEDEYLDVREV